jgi:hypothetical protein
MVDTSQQIKYIRDLKEHSYEYMQIEIRRIVENATIAASYGNTYPLDQLRKIADMQMPEGVTTYLDVLKKALEKVKDVPGTNQRTAG